MDSGAFITPNDVLFMAAGMAGDKDYKTIPRGFYLALIQEAFNDLNMTSLFADKRADFEMPANLVITLPTDCISVKNVYMFTGDACTRSNSRKVWWKRNYYTEGNGFIANDTGRNAGDPYYNQRSFANTSREDKNLIRVQGTDSINSILYYEVENMNLMLSSSCLGAGNKVHLSYKSTGGELGDAPIIPLMFKTAIQDFVIEAAMRYRMANEPSNARIWMVTQQMYERRLDKAGMNGSWHDAIMKARSLSKGKREDLATYLGKAAWATGR